MQKLRVMGMLFLGLTLLFMFGASGAKWQAGPVPQQGRGSALAKAPEARTAATVTGGLPLYFVQNQGQADSRARYILRAGGQTVYLTDDGIVFDSFFEKKDTARDRDKFREPKAIQGKRLVWRLDFEGANPRPRMEGESLALAKFNYLKGNDPAKWITDIPSFQAVVYHELYPGIDLKLYGHEGRLEYDLTVNPGANPKDITLACRGIDKLAVRDGDLVAATPLGEIRQTRPRLYQEKSGKDIEIKGEFKLLADNRYTFQVEDFDPAQPLVIDPAWLGLDYSTYLGGGSNDYGKGIDEYGGFLYVTGFTYSGLFPVTSGAYDTVQSGSEAFVSKIDPGQSGSASLIWSTFLGGTISEEAYGIHAGWGEPFVCGTSSSDDFPLVNNGYLGKVGSSGNMDAFVARLNSSGNGLDFSVLFGTASYDHCKGLSVSGNAVWVCGTVWEGDSLYPIAPFRQSYGSTAPPDTLCAYALQLQFNPLPVALGQVIVIGGSQADEANGIAVNPTDVFIVGDTWSSNFPTSASAYDSTYNSGSDVFVAKFDWAGNMAFSTYLGESNANDYGSGISLGYGGAYICAAVGGSFPIVNGYDSSRGSNNNSGYVARLKSDGSTIDYSTYIECEDSRGDAWALAIRTGGSSRTDCWVAGTASLQLAYLYDKNYYQLAQGWYDAFVVRIDTAETGLDSLIFGTHLGGNAGGTDEEGEGVAGSFNNAYVTGHTNASNFPLVNAYQITNAGNLDVFVSNLREPLPAVTTNAASPVYSTSAFLNGRLTAMSGAPRMNCYFEWGTVLGGPYPNQEYVEQATSVPHDFTHSLTSLTSGQTYYYRAYIYNGLYDYIYGAERSFTALAPAAPTVTTTAVSNITGVSADSGGNVTNSGSDPVTDRGVCWNTGGTPTISDSHTHDGGGAGAFTSGLTGLSSNTTYHVRAYATNAVDTSYGSERTFTTDTVPTVTTTAISNITGTTADSGGNVTSDGGESVTARGVCWNIGGTPTTADFLTSDGTGTGSFTSNLTGLSPSTTYYVRAYATNSVGTAYGAERSFTTPSLSTVTTTAITNITGSTASSGGNVTADGGNPVTDRGVCWNIGGTPTTSDSHTSDGTGTGAFTSSLSGLTSNTTYHVRAYATNVVGTSYGNELTFTTDTVPTVTTAAISNITGFAAQSGGNVTADGGESVTARGVCWNTTGSPTTADSLTSDGTGTGAFTSNLSGLTPDTTYHVRAYATNSVGTDYGSEVTFTTDTVPTVTTTSITNVGSSSADSGGNVTSDGGEAVTARGVCWNTTGTPTTSDNTTSNGTGTGSFVSNITGLTPGLTYYVRAYATNSVGTAYGGQESFTTIPEVPVALAASAIGASSFQANWNAAAGASGYRLDVATDGGFSSIVSGYNNLDVGNVTTYLVNGLTPATPYFYRLRAYNGGGASGNSNVISLTTLAFHTVTFAAGAGGTLSGNLTQVVMHGADCSPVRANPNAGYRFIDWSGTGGFFSVANPLTVANVQADMAITARFANAAPTVRIINPADGASVWGSVNVQAEAADDSGVQRVDFFVDGVQMQAAGLLASAPSGAAGLYSFVWNSVSYANGPHVIRAVAFDAAGATSMDQITVNLQNVMLSLSGQRMEDRAWIIRKEFVRLNLTAVSSGNAPVAKYVITRRSGSGAEEQIASINASELQNGAYEYNDLTLPSNSSCTYRVLALTAADMVVGQSNQVSL